MIVEVEKRVLMELLKGIVQFTKFADRLIKGRGCGSWRLSECSGQELSENLANKTWVSMVEQIWASVAEQEFKRV